MFLFFVFVLFCDVMNNVFFILCSVFDIWSVIKILERILSFSNIFYVVVFILLVLESDLFNCRYWVLYFIKFYMR